MIETGEIRTVIDPDDGLRYQLRIVGCDRENDFYFGYIYQLDSEDNPIAASRRTSIYHIDDRRKIMKEIQVYFFDVEGERDEFSGHKWQAPSGNVC